MTGLSTLTALSWDGPLPLPGHFLKADRGRTAFLIVEVKRPKKPCGHVARFVCDRRYSLNNDDTVHRWKWAAR